MRYQNCFGLFMYLVRMMKPIDETFRAATFSPRELPNSPGLRRGDVSQTRQQFSRVEAVYCHCAPMDDLFLMDLISRRVCFICSLRPDICLRLSGRFVRWDGPVSGRQLVANLQLIGDLGLTGWLCILSRLVVHRDRLDAPPR
jgi:hypothetical protein